jgi:hypothetical protein
MSSSSAARTALRAEGLTLRKIADRLNAQGLATSRGAAWTATQVQRVLRRSAEAVAPSLA